jgi:hypothetical protein
MQSPDTRRDARIAGALYMIVITGGVFAGIVQDSRSRALLNS